MILIRRYAFQISNEQQNLETIGYAGFADLKKLKKKSTAWRKSGIGKIDFVECYLPNDISTL